MGAAKVLLGSLTLTLLAGEAIAGSYLYVPTPVTEEQVRQKQEDAVAVREVTVARGDTLKRISRRFSGRASYFPQILLFTRIANPDLIHPGQVLRVPVAPASLAAATGDAPVAPASKAAQPAPVPPPETPATPAPAPIAEKKAVVTAITTAKPDAIAPAEQALFTKAVKAANKGKYRQAIETFDRFLARYPGSPLAADATLYRADCYLRLSRK
jgi:TolA-binding protein